jgi:hypothetical protein
MMTEEVHPVEAVLSHHGSELRTKSKSVDHHDILLDKAQAAAKDLNKTSVDRYGTNPDWKSSKKILNDLFDLEDKNRDKKIDQAEWEQLYPAAIKAFKLNEINKEQMEIRAKAFRPFRMISGQVENIEKARKEAESSACIPTTDASLLSVNLISCIEAACSNDLDGYVAVIFETVLGHMERPITPSANGTTSVRDALHRTNIYNSCDVDHDGTVSRKELVEGFEQSVREELAAPLQTMRQNCDEHLKLIIPELEKLVKKKLDKQNEGRDSECVCILM